MPKFVEEPGFRAACDRCPALTEAAPSELEAEQHAVEQEGWGGPDETVLLCPQCRTAVPHG
ncbi:hypothetical protein [Tsukamurella tyrosinosolvens]|nr:hypothetical protein [Tsukamurella tyrosinosolvens]